MTFLFSLRHAWFWALLVLLPGCTDEYLPEAVSTPPSYLVVDGFLNSQGVTTIKLSRTYAIAAKNTPPVEARATVYIEDQAGARLPLRETTPGTYASPAQTLNVARQYRLHIATAAGQQYASAYGPVKTTPPIDAVTFRPDNQGLNIYVNTHDDTRASEFYRWEYDETWEINPVYRPQYEYVNRAIRDIVVPYPSQCWGNAHSTVVQISKTTALTQDRVADFRVRQFPTNADRLNTRYSILVQQHALTREEYAYWELLRKNTESIGSLFDPQPAQVTGNVRNLGDEAETVLGFVSTHSQTEKRIFVSRADLPRTWLPLNGYESCLPPDSVFTFKRGAIPQIRPEQALFSAFNSGDFLPIDDFKVPGGEGYTSKTRDCIDCRTRGTATRPSFW